MEVGYESATMTDRELAAPNSTGFLVGRAVDIKFSVVVLCTRYELDAVSENGWRRSRRNVRVNGRRERTVREISVGVIRAFDAR